MKKRFKKLCHPELVSGSINAYDSALTGKMDRFRNKFGMTARRGFTLAEVLITLGIIGIVAAMTIPTLVANYQAKSWSTSASVFERKLEEALKVMNTQQTLAGYTTTEDFVNELKKHIKIIKTCNNDKLDSCFPKIFTYGFPETETMDITTFTDSSKLRKEPFGTNTVGVQFANGVAGVLAYDPSCRQDPYSNTVTGMGCISMIYDTSGNKSPNESTKDLRMLNVNKLHAFKIEGTKFGTPFTPEPHKWNACQSDGTSTDADDQKFMSDYGIRECCGDSDCQTNGDYWAGAVALCGGKSNMPTEQQLADIATYIYGMTVPYRGYTKCQDAEGNGGEYGEYGVEVECRDDSKALSLGFKISPYFVVWTNGAYSADNAYYRSFGSTSTGLGGGGRYDGDNQAVCVID